MIIVPRNWLIVEAAGLAPVAALVEKERRLAGGNRVTVGNGERGGRRSASSAHGAGIPSLTVAVLFAACDARAAEELTVFFYGAGARVVRYGARADIDGLVILLSCGALADDAWMTAAKSVTDGRLIPVRLESIDADLVPKPIRVPNWIDWAPGSPGLGRVLAGLVSDPALRNLSRQLAHAAQSWEAARRSDDMLVYDYGRARQMRDVLADLTADPMAVPSPQTVEFVRRSVSVARRRWSRRLLLRGFAALAALGAISSAAVYLPQIAARRNSNHEAIVTTGDTYLLSQLPAWSAANSGALLLHGTAPERTLARETILEAFSQPWEISYFGWITYPEALVPYDRGSRAVLLYRTGQNGPTNLASLDVRTGAVRWSVPLPGNYLAADVSPDGMIVTLAGSGIATVNLRSQHVTVAKAHGNYSRVVQVNSSEAALASPGGMLYVLSERHGSLTRTGSYSAILDVARTGRNSATALVTRTAGRYLIVDAFTGRVIAAASLADPVGAGTISPDGRTAALAGPDGQLWTMGVRQRPQPTGIPVPFALLSLHWASGERLIISSEGLQGQVYYLPRAEYLGTVCQGISSLAVIRTAPGTDVVGCLGLTGGTSFWQLPPAPLPGRRLAARRALISAHDGVTVMSRRGITRISWMSPSGRPMSRSFALSDAPISALKLSPDGSQVVVGSATGDVAVLSLALPDVTLLESWHVPDSAPIAAVGWRGHTPIATTRSEQTWPVPDCPSCGTDRGILTALRHRLTGCFTQLQAQYIDQVSRHDLGLRICMQVLPVPAG